MNRALSLLFAVLMGMSTLWTAETVAQTQQPSVQEIGAATKVTLEDGTQLTIPASVKVQRATLKEGVTVKATYQENRGQKVVTSIQVRPES